MMAKLAQTVSIYVALTVLPVLVLSATRKEHPLTLLHEMYMYMKTSVHHGWGLAMRIMQKVPITPHMNSLLTRLGLSPQPSNHHHHTTINPPTNFTEEVEQSILPSRSAVRDEYADILSCTIRSLRQGEDLSLAYRELSYIPTFFAANPEGTMCRSYSHISIYLTDFAYTTFKHYTHSPIHIHTFTHSYQYQAIGSHRVRYHLSGKSSIFSSFRNSRT